MSKQPSFSTKISLSLAKKLRNDLEDQGFTFSKPPYTLFSAKKEGVSLSLYESGALVVQGKEKEPFIEFYLEPEILKDFSYTNPLVGVDFHPRLGVDEAGKGDFFGPLCVTCLYADKQGIEKLIALGVKDSKRLTDKKIITLGEKLEANFTTSTLKLFPLKYNELYSRFKNLNRMLAWGHATVLGDLFQKTGCKKAILDKFGPDAYVESALKYKGISLDLTQITKGEQDPVVAAASIIARMSFVKGIDSLSKEIGVELPKGANHGIIEVGKRLVAMHGEAILEKAGKLHFKTKNQIINS